MCLFSGTYTWHARFDECKLYLSNQLIILCKFGASLQ